MDESILYSKLHDTSSERHRTKPPLKEVINQSSFRSKAQSDEAGLAGLNFTQLWLTSLLFSSACRFQALWSACCINKPSNRRSGSSKFEAWVQHRRRYSWLWSSSLSRQSSRSHWRPTSDQLSGCWKGQPPWKSICAATKWYLSWFGSHPCFPSLAQLRGRLSQIHWHLKRFNKDLISLWVFQRMLNVTAAIPHMCCNCRQCKDCSQSKSTCHDWCTFQISRYQPISWWAGPACQFRFAPSKGKQEFVCSLSERT